MTTISMLPVVSVAALPDDALMHAGDVLFVPKQLLAFDSCTFELRLFDDESVRTKLRILSQIEAMFDDSRNTVPNEYYDIAAADLGEGLEITIRRLPRQ